MVFKLRTSFNPCFCTDRDYPPLHPFRFFSNFCHQPYSMGTGFNRWISSRIFWNNFFETNISAIWNITYRAWLTTLAPIFISFTWSVLSDQSLIYFGKTDHLKELPRLKLNFCKIRAINWKSVCREEKYGRISQTNSCKRIEICLNRTYRMDLIKFCSWWMRAPYG